MIIPARMRPTRGASRTVPVKLVPSLAPVVDDEDDVVLLSAAVLLDDVAVVAEALDAVVDEESPLVGGGC